MLEVYTFLFLASALLIGLLLDFRLPSFVHNWTPLWQMNLLAAVLLLLYVGGVLLLNVWYRLQRTASDSPGHQALQARMWAGINGTLGWLGHAVLGLCAVAGLGVLLWDGTISPWASALLTLSSIIVLSSFTINQWAIRHAPAAAEELRVTPGIGYVDIGWAVLDDPRYAESLLVRSTGTVLSSPWQNDADILYRGVGTLWRDATVKPGQRYLYSVFTHDGQERYTSTSEVRCRTFPLPDPPFDLKAEAQRTVIRLTWKLGDPEVQKIHILRHELQASVPQEAKLIPIDPLEGWNDGGLRSGTTYCYTLRTVRWINGVQQESEATTITIATLVQPLGHFSARVIKRRQVELTWETPEVAGFQRVTLTRRPASAPGATPEHIYVGSESRHVDEPPDYSTSYIYTLQAHYSNDLHSETIDCRVRTGAQPAGVQQVKLVPTRQTIHLNWSLPAAEEVRSVRLARQDFDRQSFEVSERELLEGLETEYIDRDVGPDTSYTYVLTLETVDGHQSQPQTYDVRTLPPVASVLNPQARFISPDGPVVLSWQLPNDSSVNATRIVRKTNELSGEPSNGTLIYEGPDQQATDSQVAAGQTYNYAFFAQDREGLLSTPGYAQIKTVATIRVMMVFPNGKRVPLELGPDISMGQLIPKLLERHGVQKDALASWKVVAADSRRELAAQDTLKTASIATGARLLVTYTCHPTPPVVPPPTVSSAADPGDASPNPATSGRSPLITPPPRPPEIAAPSHGDSAPLPIGQSIADADEVDQTSVAGPPAPSADAAPVDQASAAGQSAPSADAAPAAGPPASAFDPAVIMAALNDPDSVLRGSREDKP